MRRLLLGLPVFASGVLASLSCFAASPPLFAVKSMTDEGGNIVALQIFKDGKTEAHQHIKGFKAQSSNAPEIELIDINFDGYKDILIQEFLPAQANVPYLYWTYSPRRDIFECRDPKAEDGLCRLYSPQFDRHRHIVIEPYADTAMTGGTRYYKWRKGKLRLLRDVETTRDGTGRVAIKTMEPRNGRLVTINRRVAHE